jgi:uncharacterized protein YxjI
MRQKMFAFGDDFTVQDEQGRKVFTVDGKAFRIRDTLLFKDAEGGHVGPQGPLTAMRRLP